MSKQEELINRIQELIEEHIEKEGKPCIDLARALANLNNLKWLNINGYSKGKIL